MPNQITWRELSTNELYLGQWVEITWGDEHDDSCGTIAAISSNGITVYLEDGEERFFPCRTRRAWKNLLDGRVVIADRDEPPYGAI